jgi:hypothetical protein
MLSVLTILVAFGATPTIVSAKSTSTESWLKVVLPGADPKVVAMSQSGPPTIDRPLYLGGSTTTDGARRPALWRTVDGENFDVVPVESGPGYGTQCEVFAVAAKGDQVAAICQAFGGAHGNPRTSAFVRTGPGQPLKEIVADFELYNGPRQIAVRSVVATAEGFTIFGSRVNRNGQLGATSWTTAVAVWSDSNGPQFVIHDNDPALSSNGSEQVQGLTITSDGAGGVIASGERLWWRPNKDDPSATDADTDAIIWRSATGESWQRWTPPGVKLDGRYAQRMQVITHVQRDEVIAAGTQVRGDRVEIVAWTRTGRRVVPELGSTDDVLSAATAVLVDGPRIVVAARVGVFARLAVSVDGARRYSEVKFPTGTPTGSRTRVGLAPLNGTAILVSVSSENGASLLQLSTSP